MIGSDGICSLQGQVRIRGPVAQLGQSARLISVRSMVQIHPGPPSPARVKSVGGVAQLGERLPCTQEVIGSSPFTSTTSPWFVARWSGGVSTRFCSLTIWKDNLTDRRQRGLCQLFCGQATKGSRWMPWCQEAMKDVASCDKLRGAAKQALIRRFLNGATRSG